jgi:putative DNA methylase
MSVKTALALINQVLAEVLSSQEGDFDSETRFCIKWFEQNEWKESNSGEADVLSRALNTTVSILERGGVFKTGAGKACLIRPLEMSTDWDPKLDKDISVWEVAMRLANSVQNQGIERASELAASSASKVDIEAVKELSYLLFSICERKNWSESGLLFNGLGTAWSDLKSHNSNVQAPKQFQQELDI